MNKTLQTYARKKILEGLAKLTKKNELVFKKMYSPDDMEKDIRAVVADMDPDKLDWAMQQVENTTKKKDKHPDRSIRNDKW